MKLNPAFRLRDHGDEILLFCPTNRDTVVLGGSKAEAFRRACSGLEHGLSDDDVSFLVQHGVFEGECGFDLIRQPSDLRSYLSDAPRMYRKYTKRFRGLRAPIGILWSVTQRCNLACPYCHASARARGLELELSDLLVIADKLIDAGVFEFVINGGEPLLREDIFDLLEHLVGAGAFVSINSNGTRIDATVAARLRALGVIVGISIDGPSEKTSSKTRGRGTLSLALEAIEALLRARVTTHVLTTVTRNNYEHLPAILDLVESTGVKIVTLQDLHPAGDARATYDALALTPDQEVGLEGLLESLASSHPSMTINTTELSYFSFLRSAASATPRGETPPRKVMSCRACTETLYVDASGDAYPCVALPDFPMGNLVREDFSAIWEHSAATKAVRALNELPVTAIEGCAGCDVAHLCMGGCRGDAIAIGGSWLAPHPRCLRGLAGKAGQV